VLANDPHTVDQEKIKDIEMVRTVSGSSLEAHCKFPQGGSTATRILTMICLKLPLSGPSDGCFAPIAFWSGSPRIHVKVKTRFRL
jgi:hypothetical protein